MSGLGGFGRGKLRPEFVQSGGMVQPLSQVQDDEWKKEYVTTCQQKIEIQTPTVNAQAAHAHLYSANVTLLNEALADFSLNLFRVSAKPQENGFLSPVSISMALGMTFAGAGGETAKQMNKVLFGGLQDNQIQSGMLKISEFFENAKSELTNEPDDDDFYDSEQYTEPGFQISLANKIYGQNGFSLCPEFVKTLLNFYHSQIETVDFTKNEEVCRSINEWVESQTKGRIKNILKPSLLSALTQLVLVNAIYFKAQWSEQFKTNLTAQKTFHSAPGHEMKVSMMNQQLRTGYKELAHVQILEMNYTNSSLSMVVFLPKERYGLAEFERKLDGKQLFEMIGEMQDEEVIVEFPKFRMDQSFSLVEMLTALGMPDMFSKHKADFSKMSPEAIQMQLHVSAVLHKAFIEVNEEGTEAAAATAAVMNFGCAAPSGPPKKIIVDHPFLFTIVDQNPKNLTVYGSFLWLSDVVT